MPSFHFKTLGFWSPTPTIVYEQGLNVEAWNVNNSFSSPLNASQFDNFFTAGSGKSLITNTELYIGRVINWANAGQNGAGGPSSAKPSYLPADFFSWKVEGFLFAPETGTYQFGVDGDDAVEVFVNGQNVANWYGAHGFRGAWTGGTSPTIQFSGTINLTGGQYYPFRARMEERAGGDGIHVGWKLPSAGSISLIPAANLVRQIAVDGSRIPSSALFYLDPNNSNSYPGSGSTVTDLMGNGNNFTLNGPSLLNDNGINVFNFTGSGHSLNGSLDLRRNWSFEIWVKHINISPVTFLGQGPTSTDQGLHIWQYDNTSIRFGLFSNDRDALNISTSANVWYQYVFTYNHSTFEKKIYRNGTRIDTTTVGGPRAYTGTGTLRIGQIYSTTVQNRDSRKRVGEMIMYGFPLSDADVLNSFNLRRGRYGI